MTRFSLLLSLTAVLLGACTPKVSETTRVLGRIEGGTADKVTVTVMDRDIHSQPIEVIDGEFCYELATEPAIVATFTCRMNGRDINCGIIPDGSELTAVFSPEGSSLSSSNRKSVNYRMVEEKAITDELSALSSQFLALRATGAPQEQLDSLAKLAGICQERRDALLREDLEKQKDNYLCVRALNLLIDNDEQLDSMIHTLDSTVIKTYRVQNMLSDVQTRLRTKEGKPFVDFSVNTADGTVRLSDYVGKGTYVLADFWAGWCGPCIAELPYLKDAYKKFAGPDLTVLGIAVSEAPSATRDTIRKYSIPWPQILGTGMVAMDAYGISGIPHIILFGPDGTILRRDLRGETISQVLGEYLPAKQ